MLRHDLRRVAVVWSPVGAIAVLALVVAWTMAALVLRKGRGHGADRRLVFLLLCDGIASGAGNGLKYFTDSPATAYAFHVLAGVTTWAAMAFYLAFIAVALRTPLVAPLRTRVGTWAIALLGLGGAAYFILVPESVGANVRSVPYAPWDVDYPAGAQVILLAAATAFLFGIVAAVDAFRRTAKGSLARRQSAAYLGAFAIRDGVLAVAAPFLALYPDSLVVAVGFILAVSLAELAYPTVLAYAILTTRLFDIDLRVKWSIRRGTLLGAFVVVFFVVAEVVQAYASDVYGYVAGGAAAGLMLVALRPLDRLAARVADHAMPNTQDTPAYVAYRKMEVYKAALEGAMQDGEVTGKEREMLRRLRLSLAITEADAAALERDLAAAQG